MGHGYKVIGPGEAMLAYLTDRFYNPQDEGRIPYDDPGRSARRANLTSAVFPSHSAHHSGANPGFEIKQRIQEYGAITHQSADLRNVRVRRKLTLNCDSL